MILYHLTWESRIPSILQHGLVPNGMGNPNKWALEAANKRSEGRLFLCREKSRRSWYDTFTGGWCDSNVENDDLRWLRVDASGVKLVSDECVIDGVKMYENDYWTTETIPPERITVMRMTGVYSQKV
jgi:hypothetical protein